MRDRVLLLQRTDGIEALLEVGDDVIDILRADGETYRVDLYARLRELLRRELRVRRRVRVNDEALDIGDIREQNSSR